MSDEMLSPHFRRREFACRCGCGFDAVDMELVEGLEALRERIGGKPIIVASGCRCPKHNKEIGGAKRSKHMEGKAADIVVLGMSGPELARAARGVFNGIGVGVTFIHVDVRDRVARWRYGNVAKAV